MLGRRFVPVLRTSVCTSARLQPLSTVSRVYADFNIYKKKAHLSVAPIKAQLGHVNNESMKVDRPGVVLLNFTPGLDQGGYNWAEKQAFGLSATECGEVMTIIPGVKNELRFLHDPNMGGNNAGSITKALSIAPFDDDTGYFFNLFVKQSSGDQRITVAVSLGELRVIQSLVSYSMPYLLGWDAALNAGSPIAAPQQNFQPPPQQQSLQNNAPQGGGMSGAGGQGQAPAPQQQAQQQKEGNTMVGSGEWPF